MAYYQYLYGRSGAPAPEHVRGLHLFANDVPLTDIQLSSIFLLAWKRAPARSENALAQRLFNAYPIAQKSANLLYVLPRIGLQTAWSSKVLDICALCHLDSLLAVEQGSIWSFAHRDQLQRLQKHCYDPMTEQLFFQEPVAETYFLSPPAKPCEYIKSSSIAQYSQDNALGLTAAEIEYLISLYSRVNKNPSDAELMMFAQVNSEHCRHKVFNATWQIDGKAQSGSLFAAIRKTTKSSSDILSAFTDNAAVVEGWQDSHLWTDENRTYRFVDKTMHYCIKVETHNHPTAIAPFAGAATGAGGEIRDEGATGTGARPKAGITGFIVSNLLLPELNQPWEEKLPYPDTASALEIMTFAPLGSANYGNEFGRPTICGFFRTLDCRFDGIRYANIKPIMLAGGIASIEQRNVYKRRVEAGDALLVLGGPSMRVGIGGGSTSSVISGASSAEIDFSSVQRDNAEIERRCQQVIDSCCMSAHNPIAFIHDIGAGGLSNAFPELVQQCTLGAIIDLDSVPSVDSSLSAMEIWCNEAQERYALAVPEKQLQYFRAICERERCPYAIIGTATQEQRLQVTWQSKTIIDIPMQALFGDLPQRAISYRTVHSCQQTFASTKPLDTLLLLLLQYPSVASKEFLVTIGDRSIGGLVAGESMIGPWQIPVADCALTSSSFTSYHGEAMAVGERTPIAVSNPVASGRMAIGELLTNLVSCGSAQLEAIKLSANWMVAAQLHSQQQALYQTVQAVSDMCIQLGIAIPVGKDSMSMQSTWQDSAGEHTAISPLSVIVTGYCRVADVRKRVTPQLVMNDDSSLIFLDLAHGHQRLGNSALAQIENCYGSETPDVVDLAVLGSFVRAMTAAIDANLVLAYHDRSDGGLWSCLCEMAFAGKLGIAAEIGCLGDNPLSILANEELGAVVQVRNQDIAAFVKIADAIPTAVIGVPIRDNLLTISHHGNTVFSRRVTVLQKIWNLTSFHMQEIRDNPSCNRQHQQQIANWQREGLRQTPSFRLRPFRSISARPQVAILREQGTNGHGEMAAAFVEAGCQASDVHMSDLIAGRVELQRFQGLVACGGFSYGDVLGAGRGWAEVILNNARLRESFQQFFYRADTFTLGVCNGCQMVARLAGLIPQAEHFCSFNANDSGRFEGRLVQVGITKSPSVLFQGMSDSQLVVAVAHGYGKVDITRKQKKDYTDDLVSMRYLGNKTPTTRYPDNPNGSVDGIAGLCSKDGRVTICMPHPERVFLNQQVTWQKSTKTWHSRYTPWFQLFLNAKKFCASC